MSPPNALLISPETCLRRTEGVVLRHVAGEHMLVPAVTREVDLDSLFLLNATGVFIWEHLDGRRRVDEIGEALAKSCSIDRAVAGADVVRFLSDLLAKHLVEPAGS